ncbi:nucleoside triphosphatase YtkD [Planococcus maritimus]|uniref:RNA deprotection pyrophosphohydrolase n=1 Tax=Planococcus maritimus TaxID=192421 RepID=UPI00080F1DEF|nr:nucleoside triphosphatase YtkD [Planococcus maritimus]ANU16784.1 nucleoside triphosphatase YtkD [Planococcus maritimus]
MEYRDLNGCVCHLFFEKGRSQIESRHVLVIGKFEGQWLLTRHSVRGLEFPGGKAEPGESLEQAAKREVYEETGAVVNELEWLAEYQVHTDQAFSKTVFTATIKNMKSVQWMETEGPVLVPKLMVDENYSFLMRDAGMEAIIEKVKTIEKWRH